MFSARESAGRARPIAVIMIVLLTSCTGAGAPTAPQLAHPEDAAARLVRALNEADAAALAELTGASGPAPDLFLEWLEEARDEGDIESYSFRISGDVPEPAQTAPPETSPSPTAIPGVQVPYEIEWDSRATDAPVLLEGVIELTYETPSDRWVTHLDRDLLWPGYETAQGFGIERDWLRRGRIVDRRGRVLARGSGDKRRYPQGSVGGMTVGHLSSLTKKQVREGAPGDRGDLVGGSGMELAYQERLAGEPTTILTLVDSGGSRVARLGEDPGSPGRRVRATLDVRVQRAAEDAYGGVTGGAVVLSPATGDILAAVPSGGFSPGNYVGARDVAPFNRALSGRYPPGSSMKVVTAAAALDTGTVKPGTTVTGPAEYKGVRNFESGAFGSIPFSSALKFSVNTAFAQVAEDLGARKLTRFAEAFGFNSPEPMPLATAESSFPRPEHLGDLMWGSIGQAQVLATPLQMASVAATIANGGTRMTPRSSFLEDVQGTRVVSRETARQMTDMMESVVQGGTGVGASISGVRVAGKTGTAEVDRAGVRENHAWFVAFAPAGAPKVAVAVVGEYAGIGGQVAAPVARSILQAVLPLVR
ncbi:MAG: peptidoglycan D,D-transpeptidase FtsI family protein [Actinomycetota bacterium]